MATDSSQENLTTRSLLKQILATEPTRSAVRYNLRKRNSQSPAHRRSRASRKENDCISSPLQTVQSKMKETVRRSLRRRSARDLRGDSLMDLRGDNLMNQRGDSLMDLRGRRKPAKGVEDLDGITPRTLLRRIIQHEPEVSLVVSQKSVAAVTLNTDQGHEIDDPSDIVGDLEMSVPELFGDLQTNEFGNAKKKKRTSVTQFERGVEQRLTQAEEAMVSHLMQQSEVHSLSLQEQQKDQHIKALRKTKRKTRMSITTFEQGAVQRIPQTEESSVAPLTQQSRLESYESATASLLQNNLDDFGSVDLDYIQKRGLVRRPKKYHFVSVEDFEQGVHENYHLLKGSQECFVESTAEDTVNTLQNKTAHMNTELYAQPLLQSPSQPDSEKVMQEEHISHRNSSNKEMISLLQSSKNSLRDNQNNHKSNTSVDQESINECLDNESKIASYDGQLVLEQEHLSNSQLSVRKNNEWGHREAPTMKNNNVNWKAGTSIIEQTESPYKNIETDRGESLSPKNYLYSKIENSKKPFSSLLSNVSSTTENVHYLASRPNHKAITIGDPENTQEERIISDEEESRIEELSVVVNRRNTNLQHMLYPPVDTPASVKKLQYKFPPKCLASKVIPEKRSKETRKEKALTGRFVKQIVGQYAQMKVSKDAYKEIETLLNLYYEQVCGDLTAYASHANRKTITRSDIELLMRRQGHVTDVMPLNILIERHLPRQYRECLIPCATSGNKVYPKI